MGDTLHWILFILVFVTLGLFFVSHTSSVTSLMSAGVTDLSNIEQGFGNFATVDKSS